jgi:hypothetical protein
MTQLPTDRALIHHQTNVEHVGCTKTQVLKVPMVAYLHCMNNQISKKLC